MTKPWWQDLRAVPVRHDDFVDAVTTGRNFREINYDELRTLYGPPQEADRITATPYMQQLLREIEERPRRRRIEAEHEHAYLTIDAAREIRRLHEREVMEARAQRLREYAETEEVAARPATNFGELIDGARTAWTDNLFQTAQRRGFMERFLSPNENDIPDQENDNVALERTVTYTTMLQLMTPEELEAFDIAWESAGGYIRDEALPPLPELKTQTPRGFIDRALYWRKTPQGHDYWDALGAKLNKRRQDGLRHV